MSTHAGRHIETTCPTISAYGQTIVQQGRLGLHELVRVFVQRVNDFYASVAWAHMPGGIPRTMDGITHSTPRPEPDSVTVWMHYRSDKLSEGDVEHIFSNVLQDTYTDLGV